MADRYYAPNLHAGDYLLEGPEAHHLSRVCRARPGDLVELFDGLGSCAEAEVAEATKRDVRLIVRAVERNEDERYGGLLAAALPKGDRAVWLIEKITELGVGRFVPLRTERSVTDPKSGKLDKLRRAALEACKQSGRNILPEIDEPVDWSEWSASSSPGAILHVPETRRDSVGSDPARIEPFAAVGPEGGWTDEEVDAAVGRGWRVVSLPGPVLRVETACVAVASLWRANRLILADA